MQVLWSQHRKQATMFRKSNELTSHSGFSHKKCFTAAALLARLNAWGKDVSWTQIDASTQTSTRTISWSWSWSRGRCRRARRRRPNGTKLDVRENHMAMSLSRLDIFGDTRVSRARTTQGTWVRRVNRISGIQPQHVGIVIVPQ